jgi:hypothetical protein
VLAFTGNAAKGQTAMIMMHAWFSAATALRVGSWVYRKPGGSTVNVTRINAESDSKAAYHCHDEKYVGEVVGPDDGGCMRPRSRVAGIADF